MATIKAIEARSVHQIQSGQVIVDLQSVCKELVENSIDAGATSIEVRFKNNGLDSIEVQDNGSGIAPADYSTIALKHYTSKLTTYDDLSALQTFGFRGEALSSLCALSHFHIVTARASDGSKGTKLEFEQSGKLKGTAVVAAKQGTTVVIDKLFYNLPVRRKELEKNIKREYTKVLQLLNAYACISVGVKFTVSNLMSKGKKTIAFSTNANPSTKDNISNVYGAKTITALIPLSLDFEMDPSAERNATQNANSRSAQEDLGSRAVRIEGHISRPVVGEGRQTPDRQMFFVNSRPCNLPQVAKAFNEVYKSFNITQSPFVFADIKLDTNAYDVNVSPDKRTIMLHDQTTLLERLKNTLHELFEGQNQSVPQAQLLGKKPITSNFDSSTAKSRPSTRSTLDDNCDVSNRTIRASEEPAEVVSLPKAQDKDSRTGFIKASLIGRFADQDFDDRTDRPSVQVNRNTFQGHNEATEHDLFLDVSQKSVVLPEAGDVPELPQDGASSPICQPDQPVPAMGIHLPQPSLPSADGTDSDIPSVKQTPHVNMSQSSIQNAFDRIRPMRIPPQQATITIGDTTTTSIVGTGSQTSTTRRVRIHARTEQTLTNSVFQQKLSGFTAPGPQMESSEDEENGEDCQNRSKLSFPIRSPSPRKRRSLQVPEELGTDDMRQLSSAPSMDLPLEQDQPHDNSSQSNEQLDEIMAEGDSDDEYIDETEKKALEEAKIAQMIMEAEKTASQPTEVNLQRASKLLKTTPKKYWTINLERVIETDVDSICRQLSIIQHANQASEPGVDEPDVPQGDLSQQDPEERLSLTVTKRDFYAMRIVGQFNLGFIIAVRPPTRTSPASDVFIIDQHASDEKYNFERLSATTTLVSQRLVHPHPLELTAVEEELISANQHALQANGFTVEINPAPHSHPDKDNADDDDDDDDDEDDDEDDNNNSARHRARLTALPMSKEVTFTPTDLEELLALLLDNPPSSSTTPTPNTTSPHIPRPTKVRKLLASRACRSSVMIGKTLQPPRMREIVRHMGSMDKPWSCPHGRPTMRHLFGLGGWRGGWREGDGVVGVEGEEDLGRGRGQGRGTETDWRGYLGRGG